MTLPLTARCAVMLVLLTAAATAHANLVVNGDFQTGDFTGWTATGNVGPYQNAASWNAGDTAPNGVLTQAIATTPGRAYTLTFYYGVLSFTATTQSLDMDVSAGATTLTSARVTDNSPSTSVTYDLYTYTFVAPGSSVTLRFRDVATNSTTSTDGSLDNVDIEPVPGFVETEPGVTGAYGVAWGDATGGFPPELGYTKAGGEGYVYGGGGIFETSQNGVTSLAWGDYDNDGHLDVASAASLPVIGLSIFHNPGDNSGFFFDQRASLGVSASQCFGVGWADVDRDGDLDLVVARHGGSGSTLFLNQGGTSFVEGDGLAVGTGVAWGDYDNDGWPDLYLTNSEAFTTGCHLYHNVSGTLVDVTPGTVLANVAGYAYTAQWVDYDSDGKLDLYVANSRENHIGSISQIFRNTDLTAAGFVNATGSTGITAERRIGAWGDVDNDGMMDLYARTELAGGAEGFRLWRNQGPAPFLDSTLSPLGGDAMGGVAWGDYDGDGQLDLAVADSTGPLRVFHNDGVLVNHWLEVDLVGTTSNRFGIGAHIEAVIGAPNFPGGPTRFLREVSASSGFLCQNALTAHFGFGTTSQVDSLIVNWPSGLRQAFAHPPIDQRITVLEGAALDVAGTPSPPQLLTNRPNPFSHSTRLGYALARRERVQIDVLDMSGRRVRRLVAAEESIGRHECTWDGRTDHGDRVPPGVYLYRVRTESYEAVRRMVLVP